MKPAQKIFSFLIGLLVFSLVAGPAFAGQVTNFKITIGDTRPTTSTSHTLEFSHPSNATLEEVRMIYCETPSAGCVTPTGLDTTGASEGDLTGITDEQWSLNNGSNGTLRLLEVGDGETVPADTSFTIPFTGITNSNVQGTNDDCEDDSDASSDTCYVRLTTYNTSSVLVDEGISSYTIVTAVTLRARVDPLFTFIIEGVAADAINNEITTSVASQYNSLDFENLTANTPKYTAHKLTVTTNTENGYTIRQRLVQQMTGVYTSNNIDPFISTWGVPTTWTEPTGTTPNDNTGWIGANTTDTDVSGWSASPEQKFGPVGSSDTTVMQESGSDSGLTSTYVSFGVEANVFQPADTYLGLLIYTALPTY